MDHEVRVRAGLHLTPRKGEIMAHTARKARKAAGIKFEKAAKVGTPVEDRAFVRLPVLGATGTKYEGKLQTRSRVAVTRYLKKWLYEEPVAPAKPKRSRRKPATA